MAVFTKIRESELEAFLADYEGIGRLSRFEGIAEGVENTNYHLFTDAGRYVLTLYERRSDPAALPFVFALMEHLNARGLPCPRILKNREGKSLGTLAGKAAAIQTFLDGAGTAPGTISSGQCRELGVVVARMHLAARDFLLTRENPMGLAAWKALYAKTKDRADEIEDGLSQEIGETLESLARDIPQGLLSCAIHADLFPDNVFFKDKVFSGVIDFGFACTDLAAYDLAIVINAWCFDAGNAFVPEHFRALIQGYGSLRPLPRAEREALPLLCRAAALRILMTRLHDWLFPPADALVRPKNPREYIEKLHFHSENNLFEVEAA